MGGLARAEDFTSFRDIDPSSDDFRCIYPLINRDRYCQRKVNKDLRSATSCIKQSILNESSSKKRFALLQKFGENCCCKNNHRKLLTGTVLGEELWRRWEQELRVSLSTPFFISDGAALDPPATVPASRSGYNEESCMVTTPPLSTNSKYCLRSNCLKVKSPECILRSEEETLSNGFEPMKRTTQTLASLLLKPLSKVGDRKYGDVYAFSRISSPGMVKVGYTKQTEDRLRSWERMCHYKPILEHCIRNVPYVPRVEKLVHYELLPNWRRELKCKHNPLCVVRHEEWFECNVDTAARSMDNFSQWMTIAQPYDTYGTLKPQWKDFVRNKVRNGQGITSQGLLDAMQTDRNQIERPLFSQTAAIASLQTLKSLIESVLTTSLRTVDSVYKDHDKAVSTVARDGLSLQIHQIIAVKSMLDALVQDRRVDNDRIWPLSNAQLPLVC